MPSAEISTAEPINVTSTKEGTREIITLEENTPLKIYARSKIAPESDQPIEITRFEFISELNEGNDDWIAAGVNSEGIFRVRAFDKHQEIKFTTTDKTRKVIPVQFAIKKTQIDVDKLDNKMIDKKMQNLAIENKIVNILNKTTHNPLLIDSSETDGLRYVYQLLIFSGSYPYTEIDKDIDTETDSEDVKEERRNNADVAKKYQVELAPQIKKLDLEERITLLWKICLNLNFLHHPKVNKSAIAHGSLNNSKSFLVTENDVSLTGFFNSKIWDEADNIALQNEIKKEFYEFLTFFRVTLGCEYSLIEKTNIQSNITSSREELKKANEDSPKEEGQEEEHKIVVNYKIRRRINTFTELEQDKYKGFFENISKKTYPINLKQYFRDFISTIDKTTPTGIDIDNIKISTDTFLQFLTVVRNFFEFYKKTPHDKKQIEVYEAKLALMSSGLWFDYDDRIKKNHENLYDLIKQEYDKKKALTTEKLSKHEDDDSKAVKIIEHHKIYDLPYQYLADFNFNALPNSCSLINRLYQQGLLTLDVTEKLFEISPLIKKVITVLSKNQLFTKFFDKINTVRIINNYVFTTLCKLILELDSEGLLTKENISKLDYLISTIDSLDHSKLKSLNSISLIAYLQHKKNDPEILKIIRKAQENNKEYSFEETLKTYPKFRDVIEVLLKNKLFNIFFDKITAFLMTKPLLFKYFCEAFVSLDKDGIWKTENIIELNRYFDFILDIDSAVINFYYLHERLKLMINLKDRHQPIYEKLRAIDFFGKKSENFIKVLIKLYEEKLPPLDDYVIDCLMNNEELCKKLLPINNSQIIFLFAHEIGLVELKKNFGDETIGDRLKQAQANFIYYLDPTNRLGLKNKLALLDSIHRHEFILIAQFGTTVYNKICTRIAEKILPDLAPQSSTSLPGEATRTLKTYKADSLREAKQEAADKLFQALVTGDFKSLNKKNRTALKQKEFKGITDEVLKYIEKLEASPFYKQTTHDEKQIIIYTAKMHLIRSGVWSEYDMEIKNQKNVKKKSEYNETKEDITVKLSKLEVEDDSKSEESKVNPSIRYMDEINFEDYPNSCRLINKLYELKLLNLDIVRRIFDIKNEKPTIHSLEKTLDCQPYHEVIVILLKNNLFTALFKKIHSLRKFPYLFNIFCETFHALEHDNVLKIEHINEINLFLDFLHNNNTCTNIHHLHQYLRLMITLKHQPIYEKLKTFDYLVKKPENFIQVLIKLNENKNLTLGNEIINFLKNNKQLCKKLILIDDSQLLLLLTHEIAIDEINKKENQILDEADKKSEETKASSTVLEAAKYAISERAKKRGELLEARANFIDGLDLPGKGHKNKLVLLNNIHRHQSILIEHFGKETYDKICEYVAKKIRPETTKNYESDTLSKIVNWLGLGYLGLGLGITKEAKKEANDKLVKALACGNFKPLTHKDRAVLNQKEFEDVTKNVLEPAELLETLRFGK